MRSLLLGMAIFLGAGTVAAQEYALRYTIPGPVTCGDWRFGVSIAATSSFLLAGGPADADDCSPEQVGMRLYDLATGDFVRAFPGTSHAVADGDRALLCAADGTHLVDLASGDDLRTYALPNGEPVCALAVHDQTMFAVGPGDTPSTQHQRVVYAIDHASGAVTRRFVVPQAPIDAPAISVAASDDLVAIGRHGVLGSPGGVFVYGATDGALRWSATAPPAHDASRFGHAVAWWGATLVVGAPDPRLGDSRGAVFFFDGATGQPTGILQNPFPDGERDLFGSALVTTDDRLGVGAPGVYEGRVFLFDTQRRVVQAVWGSDEPIGDAIAFAGDELAVGGNTSDGVVQVYVRYDALCSPATCDDHDPCTIDTCNRADCASEPMTGADGARCAVGQARERLSCLPAPVSRRLHARLDRVERVLVGGGDATARRRGSLQIRRFCRMLKTSVAGLPRRDTCRDDVRSLCLEIRDHWSFR